jgi:hypothetical protein
MEHSWEESQRSTFQWYQGWSRLDGGECCGLSVECFAADQGLPPEMEEGPHCWDQTLEGLNQERKGGTEQERKGGTEVGKVCLKLVMMVLSPVRGDGAVPSVCVSWCLH